MKQVAVVMGSLSDLNAVKPAIDMLKELDIPYELRVMSAHRTPLKTAEWAKNAKENGIKVIIAAAGKAAHLAGVVAAHTTLPVVGVPVQSSALDGMDALLSTVQMPPGIPVATMAIDGAKNAAVFAAQVLALSDKEVEQKLLELRKKMEEQVEKADSEIGKFE
jgi:5-(carboxyamino)imidazole ribonucleotide mutase